MKVRSRRQAAVEAIMELVRAIVVSPRRTRRSQTRRSKMEMDGLWSVEDWREEEGRSKAEILHVSK
jgi:hypothetical protein